MIPVLNLVISRRFNKYKKKVFATLLENKYIIIEHLKIFEYNAWKFINIYVFSLYGRMFIIRKIFCIFSTYWEHSPSYVIYKWKWGTTNQFCLKFASNFSNLPPYTAEKIVWEPVGVMNNLNTSFSMWIHFQISFRIVNPYTFAYVQETNYSINDKVLQNKLKSRDKTEPPSPENSSLSTDITRALIFRR